MPKSKQRLDFEVIRQLQLYRLPLVQLRLPSPHNGASSSKNRFAQLTSSNQVPKVFAGSMTTYPPHLESVATRGCTPNKLGVS